MTPTHRLSALRCRRALLAGWMLALLAGCQVELTQQVGTDPCDPNPCQTKGVCSGWVGTCSVKNGAAVCGTWTWKSTKIAAPKGADGKALTKPASYEAAESSCDGKDNDCDGQTDEAVVGDVAKVCSAQGVCSGGGFGALCVGGQWLCNYPALPAYQATETQCDGKDNDCDGQTDENAVPTLQDCKRQGVCAALASPSCSNGAWDCGYSGLPDYEATETKCDGKDNDCDGLADSGLSPLALQGSATCKTGGVCGSGVEIACSGGVATCSYAKVAGFEPAEQSCDGQDNDCDGKTDNFAGSEVALTSNDGSSCSQKGVCGTGKATRICTGGQFVCNYGNIAQYEATELSCDGKDNDCDGSVDNIASKPTAKACGDKGVCAAGVPVCSGNLWSCDWAAMTAAGYEAFEQSCDGKDNDCDGQTDESASVTASGCKTQGVCGWGVDVACKEAKATCDYSHVMAYEDGKETLCDGLDNDCDGQTDEADALDAAKSGCTLGVCAGKATAQCSGGKWSCSTVAVSGFEAVESSCDGKDNDCDGQTDEGLADAAACPNKGVCGGGVSAVCAAGKYLCNFSGISGYEAVEQSCDGKDNDCDGKTDTAICGATAACSSGDACASGVCLTVSGTTQKVCGVAAKQCAANVGGKIELVDDGASLCASAKSLQTCSGGVLAAASTCPQDKPVCVAGQCVICAPNAKSCDPGDKSKILQCSADGKTTQTVATCAAQQRCSGSGDCVPDAAFQVSDTSEAVVGHDIVTLKDGSFAVAWTVDKAAVGELRLRIYGGNGVAKAAGSIGHGTLLPAKGSRVALAALADGGFAAVWTTTSDGKDIALGIFDASGKAKVPPQLVNSSTGGVQDQAAIASYGNTIVVAWAGEELDFAGLGIGMRRFDNSGKALMDELVVNDELFTGSGDSPIDNDQEQPAVACRPSGECLVLYTYRLATGKGRIRARMTAADGKTSGAIFLVSTAASSLSQQTPATVWSGSHFVCAWQGEGLEGSGVSGFGIAVAALDGNGKSTLQPVVANVAKDGNQSLPQLRVTADGVMALWGLPGLAVRRDFFANGQPAESGETVFGQSATTAVPAPRATTLTDGKVVLQFLSNQGGSLQSYGLFR